MMDRKLINQWREERDAMIETLDARRQIQSSGGAKNTKHNGTES